MIESGGEGSPLITAKPLILKDLRAERTRTDSTDTRPDAHHCTTIIEPVLDHISTKESGTSIIKLPAIKRIQSKKRSYFKVGEVPQLILLAIRALGGASSLEINQLLIAFCEKRGMQHNFGDGGSNCSAHLKHLMDAGKVTRIKVKGAFRYYEVIQ